MIGCSGRQEGGFGRYDSAVATMAMPTKPVKIGNDTDSARDRDEVTKTATGAHQACDLFCRSRYVQP